MVLILSIVSERTFRVKESKYNLTLYHRAKSIKKILRKDKYWHNQFGKRFLNTNNAIYRHLLTFKQVRRIFMTSGSLLPDRVVRTRNIGYHLPFLQLCNIANSKYFFNVSSNDTKSTSNTRTSFWCSCCWYSCCRLSKHYYLIIVIIFRFLLLLLLLSLYTTIIFIKLIGSSSHCTKNEVFR